MALTNDDVLKILDIIDRSDYDDVRLEIGDLKLHVQKRGVQVSEPMEGRPDYPTSSHSDAPETIPAGSVSAPAALTKAAEEPLPQGAVAVTAPMLGTFYRAPSPGDKPFVEVGDRVGPNDTVCLVEVMKLFNSIMAGVEGTVVKIAADNASMVEYGQTLMLIMPVQAAAAGKAPGKGK